MMALFGVEEWCETGEVFSVYFGMFSQLGCFGVKDGRLGRAPAALGGDPLGDGAGLGRRGDRLDRDDQLRRRPGGRLQGRDRKHLRMARRRRARPDHRRCASPTRSSSLLCFAGVGLVYLIGVRGMATVRGAPPFKKLRSGFAHTLIPIAFAYLVAHYFSLFVFQEQAQFTYLLSDPLGTGDHRPLRHRLRRASTSSCSAPTRSGTSRSAPSSSAT